MTAPNARRRPPRPTLAQRVHKIEHQALAAIRPLDLGPEWRAYDEAHTRATAVYDERVAELEAELQTAVKAAGAVYSAGLKAAGADLDAAIAPALAALPAVSDARAAEIADESDRGIV